MLIVAYEVLVKWRHKTVEKEVEPFTSLYYLLSYLVILRFGPNVILPSPW